MNDSPISDSPLSWDQLDRHLAGELSPAEAAVVERALDANPALRRTLDACRDALEPSVVTVIPAVDESLHALRAARRIQDASHSRGVLRMPSRRWMGMDALHGVRWVAAAVLVLGVVAGGLQWGVWGKGHHTTHWLTYATANAERATITLPDGGTVALNVASRLEIPMDYMAGNRTIRLVGEGLFAIPHRSGTPLTVIAGSTSARVLGTSFVVRRYADDRAAVIAVRDGKVAVGAAVLSANQLATVGRDGVPHVAPSTASLFTFARGVLTLDGVPFPDAIVELNRWFDADIRLGDPALAAQYVKGTFAVGSLRDLSEILELTFDVRVVRDGRVLTLYPK